MHNPLNILLLCYEYPPIGGGGGAGAQKYAEAWARAGHRVIVLTSWSRGLERRELVGGVDVNRVPAYGKKNRATATNLSMLCYLVFGFFHLIRHLIPLRNIDVINTHFAIPTGPLGVLASKLLSAPNILTIIGGDIYDPTKRSSPHRSAILRRVNSFIINAAARVVAISSDTKRRAEEYYRIRRPIRVINYGFDAVEISPASRRDLGLAEDPYYLIAVGRLVERKGFEYLIKAMAALPADVVLLLIGDGPLEDDLKSLARTTGVEERVRFLGYLRQEQLWSYLLVADCYVLSSLHEGLGIVVQEAMYAGLPIVATDNGGQVDIIREGRNGLLVGTADVDALVAAISKLYSNRELAAVMARNNQEDLKQLYMPVNCKEYIDIFYEVVAGGLSNRSCVHP